MTNPNRAKEEAKLAKEAAAAQAVEDARVDVYSAKQRKITLKLLLRPGEDTIVLGSHCVSAILRAAGLPDLKGLFTRQGQAGGENGDSSNDDPKAMSSVNLSLHQASLSSTRGGPGEVTGRGGSFEDSQGQASGSSTHRKMSVLRGPQSRASFSTNVTAALSADSTKNNTPPRPSRDGGLGAHDTRSNITTPNETPRLVPFSANQHLNMPTEEKNEEPLSSPSKSPVSMLNASTKQGLNNTTQPN